MNREDHPAWAIYDLWRTNKLNEKYFSARLDLLEKINFAMDLTIAIMAPGGTVSALWFWNTELGGVLAKILLPIAAIVGVLKPLLNLVEKIKRMETCLSGYRLLAYDSGELIEALKRKHSYDKEIESKQKELSDKKRELIAQSPETKENQRLKRRIVEQINASLSDYDYYIPEDNNA